MRIWRVFSASPKPCSRCCVTVSESELVVPGLKLERARLPSLILQPILENAAQSARFKPLAEKFWYHMTNASNSDGRWPPPPLVTCAFNRDWVLAEIAASGEARCRLLDKAEKACLITNSLAVPATLTSEVLIG